MSNFVNLPSKHFSIRVNKKAFAKLFGKTLTVSRWLYVIASIVIGGYLTAMITMDELSLLFAFTIIGIFGWFAGELISKTPWARPIGTITGWFSVFALTGAIAYAPEYWFGVFFTGCILIGIFHHAKSYDQVLNWSIFVIPATTLFISAKPYDLDTWWKWALTILGTSVTIMILYVLESKRYTSMRTTLAATMFAATMFLAIWPDESGKTIVALCGATMILADFLHVVTHALWADTEGDS